MSHKIAAIFALTAFSLCLLVGGIQVDNPFTTTIWRALLAMGGTFIVGLILGAVAQMIIDENLRIEEKNMENAQETAVNDR